MAFSKQGGGSDAGAGLGGGGPRNKYGWRMLLTVDRMFLELFCVSLAASTVASSAAGVEVLPQIEIVQL